MASTNINVRTDSELKAKAQKILNLLGIDISTAINAYLSQIVLKGGIPFDLTVSKPQNTKLGGWEGRITMSDDFDAPMEEFEEYTR